MKFNSPFEILENVARFSAFFNWIIIVHVQRWSSRAPSSWPRRRAPLPRRNRSKSRRRSRRPRRLRRTWRPPRRRRRRRRTARANAARRTSRFAPTIRTTPRPNRERSEQSAPSTFTTARWGRVSVCLLPPDHTDASLKPYLHFRIVFFFFFFYRIGDEEQRRVSRIRRREALLNGNLEGSRHLASFFTIEGKTMLEQLSYVLTTGLWFFCLFSFRFSWECENKKKWQEERSRDWFSVGVNFFG